MEHIKRIWPKTADLAHDLGVPYTTAAAWKQRGSIPAKHFAAMIVAAQARGESLTFEMLHADMSNPVGLS